MVALTKIGGYELDEHLFMDEKLGFFDTERKSDIVLRGGGGKLHVFGMFYDQAQRLSLTYPSPDNSAGATHIDGLSHFHFCGGGKWFDFREELRYIRKTGILVNRYDNVDEDWPKDVEFEAYFFSHQTRKAFIELRYIKNNSSESRTVKIVFFMNLTVGGDNDNDQGVWDSDRKAFRCWDAVNPKACFLLIGSPTLASKHTIAEGATVYNEAWGLGELTNRDSYGPGNASVALQFNITLDAGASTVLPFYVAVGDSQTDVESEWDALAADAYTKLLSDTKEAWENWVDEGIIATFEDNPWLTEAWVRNLISARELTWSNGGISAASGGPYTACFVWDSFFAVRTLLQAGHVKEVRDYLGFMRTAVAADDFVAYPASSYDYAFYGDALPGGPDLVHGCYCTPMIVWELYEKTRSLSDLSDNWVMVKKYLDWVKDNFYNQTGYNLISGKGMLDHPYRYHPNWAETKYYASFQMAYQQAFAVGAQIADLTGHPAEKAAYQQVADELQIALDQRFLVDGTYKSVWHPLDAPMVEGWDIESSTVYGRVGYDSITAKKTFKQWEAWLKDYFPPHYDYINYTEDQNWLYCYGFADLLHSLILYGNYENYAVLLNRYKHVANCPKLQAGERLRQYEVGAGQTIFAWSHAVIGSLARLFDWAKDDSGNYVFSLSSVPGVGKFKAAFPDGTCVTVSGEGCGSQADIEVKPYTKECVWDGEKRKLNVTMEPCEDLEFSVSMGSSSGMNARKRFKRVLDSSGEKVEVLKRDLLGSDEYGNPIFQWVVDSVENAILSSVRGDEKTVEAGLLAVGDAVGHFAPASKVSRNFRVRTGGATYEAVSIDRMKVQGVTVYVKVNLKRVTE